MLLFQLFPAPWYNSYGRSVTDYSFKQLRRQEMEASVRFIAPTTYCSKLGVPLCFLPYLEIMQEKRKKKKKKNPKQTKKQHRAGTKGLFTHQHLEILASIFFLTFFLKSLFYL